MNTPTKITVSNWMGREVNPYNTLDKIYSEVYNKFEKTVTEHPCPSIENTKPGETVWAELRWQWKSGNVWIDGIRVTTDQSKEKIPTRQIWVPVEHKEGEGKFGEWVTEKIALKMGFSKLSHFTVTNAYVMDIGRNRLLSLGCIGTPNEMLFIESIDGDKVTDLVCLHNFDYDGKLSTKRLKQIIDLFISSPSISK